MPWLVFEYMDHGNLAEILRANSGIFSSTPSGSIGSNHHEPGTPTIDLVRSNTYIIINFKTDYLAQEVQHNSVTKKLLLMI